MKKRILKIISVVAFIFLFSFNTYALDEDADLLPEEYFNMLEELPDEVTDKLPEGIYSSQSEDIGNAILEMSTPEYIFSYFEELIGDGLKNAVEVTVRLCGILLISAVFSSFKGSVGSEALSKAIDFCSTCAIFAALIDLLYSQIQMVSEFFERLNSLMAAMIPVAGAVWAMGGNITSAAVGSGGLFAFLAVSEGICAKTIIPVSCICIALALCRSLAPEINLQGLSSGIKKSYTFILGLIMTVLLSLLAAQTSLSAAADSTAARAAKTITSSIIPVVGGSVAETLRTLASSVQYIKSIVGVSAIIFILLLLLPTLVSLLLSRFAFIFCGSVADLIGCERESRLIGELGGIYGCMIAVVAMGSVMFILALNIFIKTTVAIM